VWRGWTDKRRFTSWRGRSRRAGIALPTSRKISELRAAIRIKPDDAVAHYNLGVAWNDHGKRDEAIAELRKARDNARRGSELAQLIESTLKALDQHGRMESPHLIGAGPVTRVGAAQPPQSHV
jgi:hypothetical protein